MCMWWVILECVCDKYYVILECVWCVRLADAKDVWVLCDIRMYVIKYAKNVWVLCDIRMYVIKYAKNVCV